jgi:phenylpropionate dioxygenase-like ring-hydroxylating dioxygenase large terminal subunit
MSTPESTVTGSALGTGPALRVKRNYPANCWWVVAAAAEVTRKPLCRWLLDQRVVLFRTQAGAPVALEDRCAHRWAPLSQGKLLGDEIACPYHGFRYDSRGACALVPTQSHVPGALQVRSYPVREHAAFVWIWTGAPDKADPALLPDIPELPEPTYLHVMGYMDVNCNYMGLQENLLDPTHVPYVHTNVGQGAWRAPPTEVKVTDRNVTFIYCNPEGALASYEAQPMGVAAGTKVRRTDWGTFASPACNVSGNDIEVAATEAGTYKLVTVHCTTPVSPNRTHYWWLFAQNYGQHIPNLKEDLAALLIAAFKQDKEILEAIQETRDRELRGDSAPEVIVRADRAAVEARRIVERMLSAEPG